MIQRLKLAWQMSKLPLFVPQAQEDGFWSEEDGLALRHFFNSSTGLKLKVRLTNYVLKSAVEATIQANNLPYHCGVARGIALAVTAVENHFSQAPANRSTTAEEEEVAASFADQYAA